MMHILGRELFPAQIVYLYYQQWGRVFSQVLSALSPI